MVLCSNRHRDRCLQKLLLMLNTILSNEIWVMGYLLRLLWALSIILRTNLTTLIWIWRSEILSWWISLIQFVDCIPHSFVYVSTSSSLRLKLNLTGRHRRMIWCWTCKLNFSLDFRIFNTITSVLGVSLIILN